MRIKPGPQRLYPTNAERQAAYRARQRAAHLHQIPQVHGEGYSLYQGDARLLVPLLTEPLQALIVDPPYGIGFPYRSYTDTAANFRETIVPILTTLLARVRRGAVFSAEALIPYQRPCRTLGHVYCPAGTGRCAWGFTTMHHVLLYGHSPHLHGGHLPPTTLRSVNPGPVPDGHPCPKPVEWMRWLVDLASVPGETVVDPFMGSGTTGIACLEYGRRFVGIEVDPGYFALAVQRLEAVTRQGTLFGLAAQRLDAVPQQGKLLG
jgi:hypothetical protein